MTHNQKSLTFFIVSMSILLVLLFCGVISIFPQTQMGPIRTPQINQNLYVGQTGFLTIQSAVTFACRTGNQTFAVTIPAGANPNDTIAAVTGGCVGTYISDQRTASTATYHWSGTQYVATFTIPNTYNVLAGNGSGGMLDTGVQATQGQLMGERLYSSGHLHGMPFAAPARGYGMLQWIYPGSTIPTVPPVTVTNGAAAIFGQSPNTTNGGVQLWGGNSTGSNEVPYLDCEVSGCNFSVPLGATHLASGSQVANSPICTEATGCPGTNVTYPPAGIGVSTGTAWSPNSIDPTTLASWPATGIPVSTGTAWGTSLDPAIVARRNEANVFTQSQFIEGGILEIAANNAVTPIGSGTFGIRFGWNAANLNESDFVNANNGGLGGFAWYNTAPNTPINPTLTPSMSLDASNNLTVQGPITSFANGPTSITGAGTRINWNASGATAETDFINSNAGTSGGGFRWYSGAPSTPINATTPSLMVLDAQGDLRAIGFGEFTGAAAADRTKSNLSVGLGGDLGTPIINFTRTDGTNTLASFGGSNTLVIQNYDATGNQTGQAYICTTATGCPSAFSATLPAQPLTAAGKPSKTLAATPKSSNQTCRKDSMWHDENFIYICVKSGEVKRAALSAF